MKSELKRAAFLVFGLMSGAIAQAGTLRVPSQYTTIQAAVDVASGGDTVLVADGNYAHFYVGKSITVKSENGAMKTRIYGNPTSRAVRIDMGGHCLIEGFTIRDGVAAEGAGIYVNSGASPLIRNNVFTGNRATIGGAICCDAGSNPAIWNCVFANNHASDQGGAVYVNGATTDTILNCTFIGNRADCGVGGALHVAYCFQSVGNCIFWDNGQRPVFDGAYGSISVYHSDVQGGWQGTGNINEDPLFDVENASYHRYELLSYSPCIDSGDGSGAPGTDLWGHPRYDDANVPNVVGRMDMGAVERQTDSQCRLDYVTPNVGDTEGGTVVFIKGEGFTPDVPLIVKFGGVSAQQVVFVNGTRLIVVTPAHVGEGPVDVTVETPHGLLRRVNGFTYWDDVGGHDLPGRGGKEHADQW